MNKKGFTLIELLAVIVILAIIALIATPIILNVIDTARKGAKESSALGYIDAVEKQVMLAEVDSTATNIPAGTYSVSQLTTLKVEVKGEKPDDTSVLIVDNKGHVTEAWITYKDSDYKVYYDGKEAVADTSDYVDSKGNKHNTVGTPTVVGGPTKVAAATGETHKGIVYLDPTDLTRTCDASNSVSTTEVKTGCMKWYIFDDTGSNYTMILDHNTIARIKWNDSNSNVAYKSSNLKPVVDDLVTTSGWQVTPRLITGQEVANITGNTSWNNVNSWSWFYLDTNNQTLTTFNSTTRSKYDWLYNNLNKCKTDSTDYGCTIEDGNNYTGYGTAGNGETWGYWTSTINETAGSGSGVWNVGRYGRLGHGIANDSSVGIRPVITVPKSAFN